MKNKNLTYEEAHRLFEITEDGVLLWRKFPDPNSCPGHKAHAGEAVGTVTKLGYLRAEVHGEMFFNHRIIWLMTYGYFPELEIDHIDRNKLNNSIDNLRETSRICNIRNTGRSIACTSGVKGVSWSDRSKKYIACVVVNKRALFLGYHNELINAACARLAAEQCLGFEDCNSSSTAYKYVKKELRI